VAAYGKRGLELKNVSSNAPSGIFAGRTDRRVFPPDGTKFHCFFRIIRFFGAVVCAIFSYCDSGKSIASIFQLSVFRQEENRGDEDKHLLE
jgi:hypothetical protein